MRLLGGALVLFAFVGTLARLRRIPRPMFQPAAAYADGRIVVGRVETVRRGERHGVLNGWTVVCGQQERVAWWKPEPPAVHVLDVDRVEIVGGDGRRRVLDARDCSLR